MTGYILSVYCVAALLGILSQLSFDKSGKRGERAVFAVLLLYTVLTPVGELVGEDLSFDFDIPSLDEGDLEYEQAARRAFEAGVVRLIADKYSLPEESVRVMVEELDVKTMRAGKIRVILSGRAAFADYRGIEEYINRLDMGVCEVEIEIG